MPCDNWFQIEKQYQLAVHAYDDAVTGFDTAEDFDGGWKRIELARMNADRARCALLQHQQKHGCVPARTADQREFPSLGTDELILGDQGQPGG